jgi:hypothetical protein
MPIAVFPPWTPDHADLGAGSRVVQNVFRRKNGTYGAMRALSEIGNALDGVCKGAGSFYSSDGTIVTFAGTATKLYLWNATTQTWGDVTRAVGGDYTLADEHRWVFTQVADRVFADNGVDAGQYWDIGTSTNFAAAPGSPPIARYAANSDNGFLHRAHTTTDNREAEWSSQFDPNEHTPGTNQGDVQTFQEGGRITGLVGGEVMVWFQEQKIRRGFYVGPDLIFQINELASQLGCTVPGSIASRERTIVFRANDGFYRLDGAQSITPIGDGVDDEFWTNLASDSLHSVWSIMDPLRPYFMIAWPTSTGIADTLWVCNLALGSDGWAPSSYNIECLFPMYATSSIDLDTDSGEAGDADLDTPGLPSLDSDSYRGSPVQVVAAFTSNHKLAFFTGDSLEATLDTVETAIGGVSRQVEIDRMIPLITGGSASVSPKAKLGYRQRQQDAVTYSSEVTADDQGDCWLAEPPSRFQRARVIVPSGSNFTHAIGVEYEPRQAGDL